MLLTFTGSIIGEYTGELITDEEFLRRIRNYNRLNISSYCYDTGVGLTVDGGPMGNHTRFWLK